MTNRALELLYDSEATLRLVDHELDELREFTTEPAPPPIVDPADPAAAVGALAMVPVILQRANAEIASVMQSLRQCRSQLESATTDKLQITHEKLREVTSATEVAATDILDGLDRAHALLDEMDADAATHDGSPRGHELRGRLRDEVFLIAGHLQFQDITTQQLSYASSVLVEMESRLSEIARLFDPRRYGAPELPPVAMDLLPTFSRDASFVDAEGRQRVADQIFTIGGTTIG
jgi:chemotaxis regulatin CheY-phosphate phosphatase CheZ